VSRARLGNPLWSWERVLPFFIRLETDLDFPDLPYHGKTGPIPIRRHTCDELVPLQAAGFLNNILLEATGRRVLVKGRTYKESIPVESDDPDVEVEREVLRTSVVALDLRSGRFEVIEH